MHTKKIIAATLALWLSAAGAVTCASALEAHSNGLTFRTGWFKNDPAYAFSDAYKTSVWHKNFSTLTLTDNQRNNVLRVAISQLGYHEGDSTAEFDGYNRVDDGTGNGTGNVTEYARLIKDGSGEPYGEGGVAYSFNWCACFVNWCLNQAQVDHAYAEISCGRWIEDWFTVGDNTFYKAKAFGGTYTPRPADLIFFDWDGKNTWPDHIGLVLWTDSTTVYTIEGNTKSNNVGVRSYPLDSNLIRGYGAPAYTEGTEATLDFSPYRHAVAGTYIVHGADAPLTPDNGKTVYLSEGTAVTLAADAGTAGTGLRVTDGTYTGEISRDHVILMTPAAWVAAPDGSDTETEGNTEPTTEPTTEGDTKPETEPATESETRPVTEPATESETQPVTEPATEGDTAPVTKPVTDPETQPDRDPETHPDTDGDTLPDTESDTEDDTHSNAHGEKETKPVTATGGCASALPMAAAPLAMAAALPLLLRRRRED